jgi:hypothetical protein
MKTNIYLEKWKNDHTEGINLIVQRENKTNRIDTTVMSFNLKEFQQLKEVINSNNIQKGFGYE